MSTLELYITQWKLKTLLWRDEVIIELYRLIIENNVNAQKGGFEARGHIYEVEFGILEFSFLFQ